MYCFRSASSSFRSSILRRNASRPENVIVTFPDSVPSSDIFRSALRSTTESALSGNPVCTKAPPSLSSLNPIVPVSFHGNNPNGANAVPGSQ